MTLSKRHRWVTISVPASTLERIVQMAYAGIGRQRTLSHKGRKDLKATVRDFEQAVNDGAKPIGGAESVNRNPSTALDTDEGER